MKSILGQLLNGRYLVVRQLKHKSSHRTYLAEDQHKLEHNQCLIKQYRLSNLRGINNLQASRNFKDFLFKEIQKTCQFNHSPQIPVVLDYFLWGDEFYLIREFIKGETLQEELTCRQLEESEVFHLLRETLTILEIIHQGGKKHLNLKPSNIIFAAGSQKIFITDFDNLKYLLKDKIVESEIIAATSIQHDYYLAPEQKAGKPEISSDFYSLGVIAIKALTGKYPHQVRLRDLDNYARASIIDLETSQTINISCQLAQVLHNLINYNPQSRYQSTQEILNSLIKSQNVVFLPLPNIVAPHDPTKQELSKPPKKKQKGAKKWKILLIIGGLLAVLGLAVTGIIFIFGREIDEPQPISEEEIEHSQNFTEYRNENYNITLKYPQEWTVRELEDPITGEVVVFTSPLENESDLFQEEIYLSIENLSITPEEYRQTIINKINNNSNLVNISYQKESTKLADKSTHSITYQRKQDRIYLQQKEIFALNNDRVYMITYIAEKSQYQDFLDTVDKMIDSFTIIQN